MRYIKLLQATALSIGFLGGQAAAGEPSLSLIAPTTSPASKTVTLRHLWIDGASSVLQGEAAVRAWPVYVKARDIARTHVLQIAFDTSVSVLPETSSMMVSLNGRDIGEIALRGADKTVVARLKIEAGQLLPGVNAIGLTMRAVHRVDCSTSATYELWTRIDPAQTGLVVDGDAPLAEPGGLGLQDLLGVEMSSEGSTPITIRVPTQPDAVATARLIRLVQSLSRTLHLPNPIVRVGGEAVGTAGLELFVGSKAELARAGISTQISRVSLDPVAHRPRITLVGEDAAALDREVDALAEQLSQLEIPGSDEGTKLLKSGGVVRIDGGRTLSFDELGFGDVAFGGHRWERQAVLSLPATFPSGSVQRAAVQLKGQVVGALQPGSSLTVRVNGQTAGSMPLNANTAFDFDGQRIEVPFHLFHPGNNTLSMEVVSITGTDGRCETTHPAPQALVQLDPRSSVSFPGFSRLLIGPNVSRALASQDAQDSPDPVQAVFPRPDPATLSTALTLFATMAANGNHGPVEVTFGRPGALAGSGILFAASADVPAELARALDLLTVNQAGPSPKAKAPDAGAILTAVNRDAVGSTKPVAPSLEQLPPPGVVGQIQRRFALELRRLGFNFPDPAESGRILVRPKSVLFAEVALPNRQTLNAGLGWSVMTTRPSSWLVVTARTAADMRAGVEQLIGAGGWNQIVGEVAVFEPTSKAIATISPSARFVSLPSHWSWSDLAGAIAMTFSDHIALYIGLLMGLMALLCAATVAIVRRLGVTQ